MLNFFLMVQSSFICYLSLFICLVHVNYCFKIWDVYAVPAYILDCLSHLVSVLLIFSQFFQFINLEISISSVLFVHDLEMFCLRLSPLPRCLLNTCRVWWLIGRVRCLRSRGLQVKIPLWQMLSKFLTHNALHYNCICASQAWKCTSELGMHKEEGQYQRSIVLYCIWQRALEPSQLQIIASPCLNSRVVHDVNICRTWCLLTCSFAVCWCMPWQFCAC